MTRHEEIMNCLRAYTRPLTAREVKKDLGYEDMDCVRPRLTEGVKNGLIIKTGVKLESSGPDQKQQPVTLYTVAGPRQTRGLGYDN